MKKYQKLFNKVKNGTKHVTLTETIKLMEMIGFTWRRGSKNHYIFYKDGLKIGLAPPHGNKFVKPIYIRNCLKAIDEVLKNEKEIK